MCDKHKSKDAFYVSTDPMIKSGVTFICKDCARDIALRKDADGNYHKPTKESVMQALEYIDKPFLIISGMPAILNLMVKMPQRKTNGLPI